MIPPLTAGQRAAQVWMGRAEAIATLDPQQLCNIQLAEDMARPWLLTVYAQRVGGQLIAPTNPSGPRNSGATPQAPVYTLASLPSVLRVSIGQEVVTMDYPGRGATYAVSAASQVNVSLVASWAGLVKPTEIPTYSARLTEAEGPGNQAHLATPRYTYAPGALSVGDEWTGLVPVRAQSVTLYPGDRAGTNTEYLTLEWMDDAGAVITKTSIIPGANPATGLGHELTQWVIPGRATQWRLALVGVEDMTPALVFNLSL